MAVDFPSSPTSGDQFTSGGATWTWDGVKWTAAGTGQGVYLPLTGGVMVGDITLKGDPTLALHPVTKQMWDKQSGFSHDNRIINGDMRIDQRNNGASGTATGVYTVDRWKYIASQVSKVTWGQTAGGPGGFPYFLGVQSSSAYASVAADYFNIYQPIEADMMSDFQWGTAVAQPVTLSFWAASNLIGMFSGAIRNVALTRSYPFTFSIPVANTWTKIIVTIPGDTSGAWILSGNAAALQLMFDLGSGSTNLGPANAWASANYIGATGAVRVVGTNGATFYLTGVKLEIGSVATPFNRQSLAKSMADCQRYYQTGNMSIIGYTGATGVACGNTIPLPVTMRAAPTFIPTFTTQTNCGSSALNSWNAGSFEVLTVPTAAGGFVMRGTYVTSGAEL